MTRDVVGLLAGCLFFDRRGAMTTNWVPFEEKRGDRHKDTIRSVNVFVFDTSRHSLSQTSRGQKGLKSANSHF